MKKWRCTICGYVHEGDTPPKRCPVCGASEEQFVPVQEPKDTALLNGGAMQYEADVIVVGSGAAAFSAAITARNQGAQVIMLEKADTIGGTTARSGGGYWIPNNRCQREAGYKDDKQDCLRYMARYSYPDLYHPQARCYGIPEREFSLLNAYYDNACEMVDLFESIGALYSMLEINWTGKPQVDYMDHLPENKGIRGRSIYPKAPDGTTGMGVELIRQLEGWAAANGVNILTGHEVTGLLQDDRRKVVGVQATANGREKTFYAKNGVIFGSGGYSHNAEMMLQFQRGPHFGGCAVPTNTGDFIRIAGRIGAQLGNLAGAFRAQSMVEAAVENPQGSSNVFYIAGDSVIIVNKYGKRVMDEKRNYTDRTMLHFIWDPQRAEWTNKLLFMIFDERTIKLWQGFPPYPVHGESMPYLIEADTLDALEERVSERLKTLRPYVGQFALDPSFQANLQQTISRFNGYAQLGDDLEFFRGQFDYDREWTTFPPTIPNVEWPGGDIPNYTLYPISEQGPYYALILAAGTLDTNGGPVTNSDAQILDWDNRPIRGLYGAGNCIASPTANAYWGAGSTIGPAMTFGYLAARHACADLNKE